MALAKIIGLETEYGIHVGSPDSNPTTASSLLINSYVADLAGRINWDFEDEQPDHDARGVVRAGYGPEVEMNLVNTVLTNGARYYVDHAHPEYSTPECSTIFELLAADRAGEVILQRSMEAAKRFSNGGGEVVVYKNNSDGKANSYGCHENYLVERALPFKQLAREFTVHLVTRQIYTGSGKIGCEELQSSRRGFEITQRADFFEEEIGLETTMNRPIINTRDEPHSSPTQYRRLHVITGDANLAEVATFLKVGVSSIVLLLIEDGYLTPTDLVLRHPVQAMHEVSHDLSLASPLELISGRSLSALDIQWELLDLAHRYGSDRGFEPLGSPEIGELLLQRWEETLTGLADDPSKLRRQLDWVAKYEIMHDFCDRHGCGFDDPRIAALDLQYHDLRPKRSLYTRLDMETLIPEQVVLTAVTDAPTTTRAYFRGECLKRFAANVVTANWDSIVFDLGGDPLQRIPMMDPMRGTAAHVATLLETSETPAQLIERLEH